MSKKEIGIADFVDEGSTRHEKVTEKKMKEVKKSRRRKKDVLKKYGGKVPQSIIKAKYNKNQIDDMFEKSNLTESLHTIPEIGPTERGSKKPISKFPWNVGEKFIKMYTDKKEWIFDPFAGHNSRMQLVHENFRNYKGYDICHEYMEFNKKVREWLLNQETLFGDQPKIELYEHDSRAIEIENNSMDMVLTSPPYWRQEKYGDEDGQLFNCKTYEEFLHELKKVVQVCYNVLKPEKMCVWCINDFRDKRTHTFYLFHVDLVKIFQDVGFYIWDLAVIDLGVALRASFPNQFEREKMLPKRHEYAIVGQKIDKKNY